MYVVEKSYNAISTEDYAKALWGLELTWAQVHLFEETVFEEINFKFY